MRALAIAALLVLASGARAQALEAECAASFHARLADAKQAVVTWGNEHERYVAARPLVEYFETHCRFLTERERAARKVDDGNAFVCDGRAPAALTAELVLRYSVEPSIGAFQQHAGANSRCLELDRAHRVGLVLVDAGEQLQVMCYDDDRPRCVEARAALARAKGKL